MLFDLDNLNEPTTAPGAKLSQSTKNRQTAKACKTWERLTAAIGKLEPGKDVHYATGAYWSTHDLVRYITEQIGPSRLTAATWSFSQPGIVQFAQMYDQGLITDAAFLVDWRIKLKVSDALAMLKRYCSKFRISHVHGKVTVLDAQNMSVSIVGSANWTNNPRIEAGVISTDPAIAEFHRNWILAEIANTDPLQKDFDPAEIPDMPQDTVADAERTLLIIRGLPGSGKTTIAALFPDAVICEVDQYFYKRGIYQFEPRKLGAAVKHCKAKALNAMKDAAPLIVVSNVSAEPKTFTDYETAAKKYGYRVHHVIAENRTGTESVHGIGTLEVDAMRAKFEVRL